MATITFHGNVVNPELKFSNDGKPYYVFSVAENHQRKSRDTGNYEDSGTSWRRVSFWGNKMFSPEALAEVLLANEYALVTGDEETVNYTKKDGTPGSSVEVRAKHVGWTPKAPRDGAAQGGSRNAFQQPQQAPQGAWGNQQAPAPTQGGWGAQGAAWPA